MPLEKHD